MKTIFKALLIAIAILVTAVTVSLAQDWDKGFKAHDNGDYTTALRELRPLAEQGDTSAQFLLGEMYWGGKGVPQDLAYAHMWWSIAAFNGDAGAFHMKKRIAKRMTASQLEKAQYLEFECVHVKIYQGC